MILRAFQLEIDKLNEENHKKIGSVSYPYNVPLKDKGLGKSSKTYEEIDGSISYENHISLVECKNQKRKINGDAFAKMQKMLDERHGHAFGMFFSTSGYTEEAIIKCSTRSSNLIILWSLEEMTYCMNTRRFLECMEWKYRQAVEKCNYNANFVRYIEENEPNRENPLF